MFAVPGLCVARLQVGYQGRSLLRKSGAAVAQLPREVVGSPSMEGFQNCGDVALRDVVSGHGGGGLAVGSADLRAIFQPS